MELPLSKDADGKWVWVSGKVIPATAKHEFVHFASLGAVQSQGETIPVLVLHEPIKLNSPISQRLTTNSENKSCN